MEKYFSDHLQSSSTIEASGVACLLIGTNTLHKIANEVQTAIKIAVIHIAEAVAKEILKNGLKKAGLPGTRYTMQLGFYADHFATHGIETIIPDQEDIDLINHTIYNEFSKNIFLPETKAKYLEIIPGLKGKGAEGIVLGYTEIPLLVKQSDCDILLFDPAKIHSSAGVDHVLSL